MLELNQNLGIAGEFQVIVRRADGSVRVDTGMQKNLILDNGLKFYLSQKMMNDDAVETEDLTVRCSQVSLLVVVIKHQQIPKLSCKISLLLHQHSVILNGVKLSLPKTNTLIL